MTIVHQIGNFEPPYSTENEIKRALESLDVDVIPFQEQTAFDSPFLFQNDGAPDLILWTHTQSLGGDHARQHRMLRQARLQGIPVIGYHLDRWWGLHREPLLDTEPFFSVDTLYTADGGPHDWESKGINHRWLPPAVDESQCKRGTPRDEFKSEIAFIGSWQPGYHPEHKHRSELITWLRNTYGDRVRFWPQQGQPAIRGKDLQDLIASCEVIIGDSCFTGTDHYWSDRIPETLGRGGFLIHPLVDGLEEHFSINNARPIHPFDLVVWEPGEWEMLKFAIDSSLNDWHHARKAIAEHGMQTVLENHTYKKRMQTVLDDLGLVP